jgi:hypothetical protein
MPISRRKKSKKEAVSKPRFWQSPLFWFVIICLALTLVMALPEFFDRFPAVGVFCFGALSVAFGIFLQVWGIRAGVYYLHGSPVYRSDGFKFWFVFVTYSGFPIGIGLFMLFISLFRK